MKKIDEKGVISLSISSLDEHTHLSPNKTLFSDLNDYMQQFEKALLVNGVSKHDVFFHGITEGCTQIEVSPMPSKLEQATENFINWVNDEVAGLSKLLWEKGHKAIIQVTGSEHHYEQEILPIEPIQEFAYEVMQTETFRGTLIQIGGKDDSVPFTLQMDNGEEIKLNIGGRELAQKMAGHLFAQMECTGTGILILDTKTMQWKPKRGFRINHFELLQEADYDEWLNNFRAINSEWKTIANPTELLAQIRQEMS